MILGKKLPRVPDLGVTIIYPVSVCTICTVVRGMKDA